MPVDYKLVELAVTLQHAVGPIIAAAFVAAQDLTCDFALTVDPAIANPIESVVANRPVAFLKLFVHQIASKN